MWIEYNQNPNGDNIDDCVVRSISKVLNIPYWDVFDGLCEVMDELDGGIINEPRVFIKYLERHGYICHEVTEKITVGQFCKKMSKYSDKDTWRALLVVNGHMTAMIGDNIYDTWNCNRYKINYIFMLTNK